MSLQHWEYFLSIEAALADCTRYVEFVPENYPTFSVEFARIIVAASAEFDAVAKGLCKAIDQNSNPNNIIEYHPIIAERYPKFLQYKVQIPRFRLELEPWKEWTAAASPDWWSKGYNKIKHERDQYFANANLKNAIYATAGLLTGIVYLYDAKEGRFPEVDLAAAPKLLEPQDDPRGMQGANITWTCKAWK
jgi:hypothetical protein